jgi:hypothetical protein
MSSWTKRSKTDATWSNLSRNRIGTSLGYGVGEYGIDPYGNQVYTKKSKTIQTWEKK